MLTISQYVGETKIETGVLISTRAQNLGSRYIDLTVPAVHQHSIIVPVKRDVGRQRMGKVHVGSQRS